MMKNITISMDDELAQRARVAAAQAGKSVSKYLAEATREKIEADEKQAAGGRNRQLEALERILAMPKWSVMENSRMPTSEERNARRR
jgi:predicted transcriptional regulator